VNQSKRFSFNSTAIWNTTSFLGIGTATPSNRLDVVGNSTFTTGFLRVGGTSHESSTFSVQGLTQFQNILSLRDKNGENIFKVTGDVGEDVPLIIQFGDTDSAANGARVEMNVPDAVLNVFDADINGADDLFVGDRASISTTNQTDATFTIRQKTTATADRALRIFNSQGNYTTIYVQNTDGSTIFATQSGQNGLVQYQDKHLGIETASTPTEYFRIANHDSGNGVLGVGADGTQFNRVNFYGVTTEGYSYTSAKDRMTMTSNCYRSEAGNLRGITTDPCWLLSMGGDGTANTDNFAIETSNNGSGSFAAEVALQISSVSDEGCRVAGECYFLMRPFTQTSNAFTFDSDNDITSGNHTVWSENTVPFMFINGTGNLITQKNLYSQAEVYGNTTRRLSTLDWTVIKQQDTGNVGNITIGDLGA